MTAAGQALSTPRTLETPVKHVLLDVGSIKTGGGVQQALNLLDPFIIAMYNSGWKISILLPAKGPLENYRHPLCAHYLNAPAKFLPRFIFEQVTFKRWLREHTITLIFSVFGFGLPKITGLKSIVCMANATTCYPDSPYWHYLPLLPRLYKRLYNHLRLRRLRQADAIILETAVMAEHMERLDKNPKSSRYICAPAPSAFLPYLPPKRYAVGVLKVLILSGLDFHKNLWRLVDVCEILKSEESHHVKFYASFSRADFIAAYGLHERQQAFDDYIVFCGSFPQTEIAKAYTLCDVVLSLSDLESFSNNYLEAWLSGMAQICSDRDFSRHICGASAIYVEPHEPLDVAQTLVELSLHPERLRECAVEGKKKLASLPNVAQRVKVLINLVETFVPAITPSVVSFLQ